MRVGLNGAGRIGRTLVRQLSGRADLEIAAINDVAPPEVIAHLYAHDSVYGAAPESSEVRDGVWYVGDRRIPWSRHAEPKAIDWRQHGVEVVVEATGRVDVATARAHLSGGVRRVLLTKVCDAEATVIVGVRDADVPTARLVSAGSCTTHAAAAPLHVLDRVWGIEAAQITTVHCTTGSQATMDQPHSDLRRARSALLSMIPTTTSATQGLEATFPHLRGRLSCLAVRVPTASVSLVEIVAQTRDPAPDTTALLAELRQAAAGPLRGILSISDLPLVSVDFKGNAHSSSLDAPLCERVGSHLVRLVAWYDNEWGYTARLVDLLARWAC